MPTIVKKDSGLSFTFDVIRVYYNVNKLKTIKNMITSEQFSKAGQEVAANITTVFPRMINYKKSIQTAILDRLTSSEMYDIRDSIVNEDVITKLSMLGAEHFKLIPDAQTLYCVSMAVGTIIKEYGWGTTYVTSPGLYELANKIQNI